MVVEQNQRFALRRFASLDEMKADEYCYWQSRPAHERLAATSEISASLYGMTNGELDAPRLRGSLVCVER